MDTRKLPLDGVRVLDFSRVIAGPTCSMALGDLGADVIKVEHPDRGDDTRDYGLRVGKTETTYFNSMNRNKRSITLDLQREEDRDTARELVRHCDVVVQNFKAGGMAKMGLSYEDLKAIKPDIVYCSVTGYASDGAEATRPGYDIVIQGESGLMAINGDAHLPPLKFGTAIVDMVTGLYGAQAVLAALFDRQRTGKGRHIEMALFDCGVMITAFYGLDALLTGKDPVRCGNNHPSIVPYGVFDAADGPLVIAVGNNAQYARFCGILGRPELADDERFRTNILRSANRQALVPILMEEVGKRSRDQLLVQLAEAGIPSGQVLGLLDALNSGRAQEAGLVTVQPHPDAGHTHVLSSPYRVDGERLGVRLPPPQLGAHSREVLEELLGR
ncbi:MAG: CoA transferase [Proteobacteria bacterium]|nr:CoA transferase [Pseudomonadota bacterium]MBS0493927.1 CoA transferase [Pseudomonadota bacterium]